MAVILCGRATGLNIPSIFRSKTSFIIIVNFTRDEPADNNRLFHSREKPNLIVTPTDDERSNTSSMFRKAISSCVVFSQGKTYNRMMVTFSFCSLGGVDRVG